MIEAALVWLTAFALFLRTLCATLAAGDAAELFLAGRDLDVTHPPGYPLLAMLVRLALALPVGSPMFRAGLVPAMAGALAVAGVWRLARRLGAGRAASAVAAAVFAALPLGWSQATMLEKYSLQLALVPPVLLACLAPRVSLPGAAWISALALAHHAIAVFLAPAWLAAWWRSPGRRSRRASLVALALVALPLSIKPLYTPLRSRALHDAESTGIRSINWCEPYHARAWSDYLRVKYYAARFGATGLETPSLRQHLAYYPAQFGWPLLLAGIAGLLVMLRRDPLAGGVAWGVLAVSAAFNARFVLPPSLAVVYHQDAFLLLAVGVGVAFEALRRRLPGPAFAALGLAAGGLVAGRAAAAYPARDASRHFAVYDFNRAQMAIPPRGAVFLASFDYDMFAVRWFDAVLGWRSDLVPLQVPFKSAPGQFVVRRRYRPWAAALLPGARLDFTDDDDHVAILRRIVTDNAASRCFALSELSEPALLPDLFDHAGNVFLSRGGSCGDASPARALKALRAASTRSWFTPARDLPAHAIVHELWAQAHWLVAGRLAGGPLRDHRLPLLRARTRILPRQSAAWLGLAVAVEEAGRMAEAAALVDRARGLEPDLPDAYLALLRLQTRTGALDAAAVTLRAALDRPAFGARPDAATVRSRLDAGDAHGAVEASRRWFAAICLDASRALPGNPEHDPRKVSLLRLAADLAPDWTEAQAAAVGALQLRGRHAEAAPYLERLRRQDPARRNPVVMQAAALLAERRFADAQRLLAPLVAGDPAFAAGWFYLGQAELGLGNATAAGAAFRRFLALAPDSPQAPTIRQALASLTGR